jgi:hypothetical protein
VGGCYKIRWEYYPESGLPAETICNDFFVISPSYYQNFLAGVASGQPLSEVCKAFYCGQMLRDGDLSIYLKDENGFPANAYAVYWSIIDCCTGCPLVSRTEATPGVETGSYYANWFVNLTGGEYKIKWEWMAEADSPLESACMTFSIICNDLFNVLGECVTSESFCVSADGLNTCCIVKKIYVPVSNPCSPVGPGIPVVPVTDQCCPFEIPRVVHLFTQVLPAGGAYSTQPAYQIPDRIREIIFYVRYKRGMEGGFPSLRLLWSDGEKEFQSSLRDVGFYSKNTALTSQDIFLNDLNGPEPSDDNWVNFLIETNRPGGTTSVRLLAAELGKPMAPGQIEITLTASSSSP